MNTPQKIADKSGQVVAEEGFSEWTQPLIL